MQRTIRLSGTTAAERAAGLLVPRLRFSRSDRLRTGTTFQGPGANYTVQSNSRPPSSVSNISTTGQVSSTAGSGQTGRSSAFNSATSRIPSSRGSAATRGNASSTPTTPNAAGADGLGSTSGQLFGGGGGGGGSTGGSSGGGGGGRGGSSRGGGDTQMVLQSVAGAGSLVKVGTPIAEFDRQYMLNRLEDYEASVIQMEASFKKLLAELQVQRKLHAQSIENAKAALDQARLDVKMLPVLGRMDAERVKLAEEEAAARYKQLLAEVKFVDERYAAERRTAEYEMQVARLELKRAQAMVDQLVLKAPISGLVVMQTMFRSGEMAQIQAGDQLWPGMMFMQVVDPSSMVINATVNQVDAESLRVGAKAKVRIDAFPGLELPARVHAIAAMTRPGGYRAAFVKDIPVQLKLEQMDPRVIPDLSVSADVVLEEEAQATIAPLASVFSDGDSGNPYVLVKAGTEWKRREVQLGLANFTSVVIRSGLQPGDVVAVERPETGAAPGTYNK